MYNNVGEVLCVSVQCCVLCSAVLPSGCAAVTSASHACVCITEQLGHLLSSCLLHAICALQGPITLPRLAAGCSSVQREKRVLHLGDGSHG